MRGSLFWPYAYLGGVCLVLGATNGLPRAAAPILLAMALPAALAASRLRERPFFGPWIVAVVPLALALWRIAGEARPETHLPLFLFAACGAIAFFVSAQTEGKTALPLAALGLLACVVAYFSSGHGGSDPMIAWYLRHGISQEGAHTATLAFRKTVHFTFYGTVGWTAYRAALAADAPPREAIRTGLFATLAVASFDELRQLGYANRSGSVWDVLLDLCGAATFVGLSAWRARPKG